jgi:hypothetical protein
VMNCHHNTVNRQNVTERPLLDRSIKSFAMLHCSLSVTSLQMRNLNLVRKTKPRYGIGGGGGCRTIGAATPGSRVQMVEKWVVKGIV